VTPKQQQASVGEAWYVDGPTWYVGRASSRDVRTDGNAQLLRVRCRLCVICRYASVHSECLSISTSGPLSALRLASNK